MLWEDAIKTPINANEPAPLKANLAALENYSILRVKGEKAFSFLQGQCTCDINLLEDGLLVMGAHCNHKGRMHSTFIGAKYAQDEILLRVHSSIAEHAQQNLQKYAALSRVSVEQDAAWTCLGITGPEAATALTSVMTSFDCSHSPEPGNAIPLGKNSIALVHTADQIELWCREDVDLEHFSSILALPRLSSSDEFQQFTLQRGIAELESPLIDQLLPQEINFQFTNGVSFSKGCYTGQEIVARMHYKAQLKKHMYLGTVQVDENTDIESIAPGTPLVRGNGKACGLIINGLSTDSPKQCIILALCDDDALDDASVQLDENLLVKVQWEELPYAIS